MTRAISVAIGAVRAWTRLYTSHLDPALRNARRAEIESDLWESHEDARRRRHSPAGAALHVMARLILGVPHDVLWSLEHWRPHAWPRRRVATLTAIAAIFFLAFWVLSALQDTPLPPPPPSMVFVASPPPPPPPPAITVGPDGNVVRLSLEPPRR